MSCVYSKGVLVLILEYEKLNAIPVSDHAVVLTQISGHGWQMKKYDVIKFDYKGLCTEDVTELLIGLIRNDVFKFAQRQSLKTTNCHLIIPEDGLYHLCILRKY